MPRGTIVTSGGDWSPHGNAIVFSRRVSSDTRQSLWVVHSDGNGLREIVAERATAVRQADRRTGLTQLLQSPLVTGR